MLRHSFTLIIYLFLPLITLGQVCTGALGDNIFVDGDFGSGTSVLVLTDPNIAPGYNYTLNVPPVDGQYVIANSINTGSSAWPTWLGIGDNSADPNGYMMVVNASFDPGLFYEQTVSGLCENTVYEFSADIINLIKVGIPDHIDPDVSFLIDGVELFATGIIPKTNNWATYGFTFTTNLGQESLTLSLRNNAPGGKGNDLALDNISFRPCGPEVLVTPTDAVINLCESDPPINFEATIIGNQYTSPVLQWQKSDDEGMTWVDIPGANANNYTHPPLMGGTYYYRLLLADGQANLSSEKCRVISKTKIIKVLSSETTQFDTLCAGLTLMVGNSIYSETGIYSDTFINNFGCDSIWTTDLTIVPDTDFMADYLVTPPCPNLEDGSIAIVDLNGGMPPFNYTFEGVDFDSTSFFSNLTGGETYSIVIQDDIGCSIELAVFVDDPVDLFLDLGPDQIIELGETVNLFPLYNFIPSAFNWQSNVAFDCVDFNECEQISLQPIMNEQVTLELSIGNGCSISDSIFIEVTDVRKVWIPNAFSPNGDGLNDFFTVFGEASNVKVIEELKIFSRWGGVVFTGKNFLPNVLQNGWDGTFKGKPLPSGVYVYTVSVRFIDGEVLNYSGDILLAK